VVVRRGGGWNDVSQVISETKGWNSLPTDYIMSIVVPFPLKRGFSSFTQIWASFSLPKAEEITDSNDNAAGF
jgi:hypothetical protein